MSENLNRSVPAFSKYDSMSIEELEEILRADAMGPERDDSDVDEILYVMEVLANKRRQNGIAGKTALEAYQKFQQHYLPMIEEEKDIGSVPGGKATIIPFRRIASMAAALILIFTLATAANAFGWKDVWNAVAKWATETFSFSTGVEVSEPKADSELNYESLSEVLTKFDIADSIVPTWFPDGYTLVDISIAENPIQDIYIAFYRCGDKTLKVSIKTFLDYEPEQLEKSDNLIEKYTANGTDYYIMSNNELIQATWIKGSFECYIAGDLSIEEIKKMIDSI